MSRNHCQLSYEYCVAAINDQLPNRKASKLEKLAYQRHLTDLQRQHDGDYPYYFDEAAGNRHAKFMEKLPHTKGTWRGNLLVLENHQLFLHTTLFGWKRKDDNLRRFNKVFWMLPRKSGKSLAAAGIGLYMAFCDNEPGAEVYAGAQTEKQAMCVFEPAYAMCKLNPDLVEAFGLTLTGTQRNPTSVYRSEDMSRFEPVVGKASDGQSPHAALIDEYHEAQTSALYDSMSTGMGARSQPLLCVITTAGVDISSPCYEMFENATKVIQGTLIEDNLFAVIFGVDPEDSYEDFDVWRKANPNLGVSVNENYLRGKYNDALTKLGERNILLTKHLNMWQSAGRAWLDMIKFKSCGDASLKLEHFAGRNCYLGLDLASKIDVVALEILFEIEGVKLEVCPRCGAKAVYQDERYNCANSLGENPTCSWNRKTNKRVVCFSKFYLPEATVAKKENQHYQLWEKEGLLTATEGERTDFNVVEDDLKMLNSVFNIQELVFDPREASMLISNIQKWASFECVEFTQSAVNISEPCKELEAMVTDNAFLHDGNKMFEWMCGNVVLKQSRSGGNVKHYFPTKTTNANKIDGAVGAIMALARLMANDEDTGDSYNARAARGEENILRVL